MENQTEVKTEEKDVDEKGVPWQNRLKELERKFQDKYEKELAETRRELNEIKSSRQTRTEEPKPEDQAKNDLMEFVKNPKGYVQNAWREAEFQREIPAAENWIRQQKGYSPDQEARIMQIIAENKLNTPFHTPMERARTAWNLLEAEMIRKKLTEKTDEQIREEKAHREALEGSGKSASKEKPVTRNDVLRKLADAEAKGDIDAAIRYTSMLEDIR